MFVFYWFLLIGLFRELYDWLVENVMIFIVFLKRLFFMFSCKIEKKNERIGLNLEGCVFVVVFFFFLY